MMPPSPWSAFLTSSASGFMGRAACVFGYHRSLQAARIGTARDTADTIVGGLEGAMLVARLSGR